MTFWIGTRSCWGKRRTRVDNFGVSELLSYPRFVEGSVHTLCTHPYRNHPKGCPNFGKKEGCPPKSPLFADFVNEEFPIYVVYNRFWLEEHVDKMRSIHPGWSDAQLRCCLYWQPRARKQLKAVVEKTLNALRWGYSPLYCPESNGVDVTSTMKQIGIELEWPPIKYAYQVALLVIPKRIV